MQLPGSAIQKVVLEKGSKPHDTETAKISRSF